MWRTAAALTAGLASELVDLAVPRTCGGCGTVGVRWCTDCESALHDVPALIRTTVTVGVPVWTLGRYTGPRRRAVIECKERGRTDLTRPLGRALAHAVLRLRDWGEFDGAGGVALVPAPTTAWAARRRGGDVVSGMCTDAAAVAAPVCRLTVWPALVSARSADSVGLSAAQRAVNVAGSVRLRRRSGRRPPGPVIVVDDVVTTGATLAESVAVLTAAGATVVAALTVAAA
jgi:predicted amidophosphoribosyltransferase